jgi:recombination protein RecT
MTTTEIARIEDDGLGKELLGRRSDFLRMLGTAEDAERFIQEAYSAVNANPFLRRCTAESLFGALYFAAQLGLPVGGPLQQFHLTPRSVWNPNIKAKEWQVVPVVGYNGLITLAMNTGEYDAVEGKLVYANDDFEEPWEDEAGTHFKLRPAQGERGEAIGVIGRALVKGADRSIIEYLTIADIIRYHRPKEWEKTPWGSHPLPMYRKTGVRVASKYTAKSRGSWRFVKALEGDGALITLNPAVEATEPDALTIDHTDPVTEDWVGRITATDDKADLELVYKEMGLRKELTDVLTALVLAHSNSLVKDSRVDKPSQQELAAALVGRDPAEPTAEEYDEIRGVA